MPTHPILEPLWTVQDVAQYLRLHPNTIYELIRDNKLPMIRVGKSFRIEPSHLKEFLQSQADQGPQNPVLAPPAAQAGQGPQTPSIVVL
jgi:excisionase family DNA binding protein